MSKLATVAARLVLPVMFAAAVAIPAMTHAAPVAGWSGNEIQREMAEAARPSAVPTWDREAAQAFPACEATREGVFYPVVVVVAADGDVRRMGFEDALERSESAERADDVWVVGGCAK